MIKINQTTWKLHQKWHHRSTLEHLIKVKSMSMGLKLEALRAVARELLLTHSHYRTFYKVLLAEMVHKHSVKRDKSSKSISHFTRSARTIKSMP